MQRRILFGVAAWLLGAATATAGSLLAISLLGQGITGSSGQLLTQDAVNRALGSEAAEASPSDSPTVTATAKPSRTAASPTPPTATTPAPSPAATATTAPPPSGQGTVLTSPGGEAVATCQAAGVYLISWSPLQGYEIAGVTRGPAAMARVTFDSDANRVTMVVSCSAGVPSATSYTRAGDE
ncbi:MAG TPA: hypothetical protein VKG80_21640 [Trebonia sp.]|nr:hypothetical protein [Trebonia sp.]